MKNQNFEELQTRTQNWFKEKGIISPENVFKQYTKLAEESGELAGAIFRNNIPDQKDAIGDLYITLEGVCLDLGLSFQDCVETALNVIEKRKTKTINGKVMKVEEL